MSRRFPILMSQWDEHATKQNKTEYPKSVAWGVGKGSSTASSDQSRSDAGETSSAWRIESQGALVRSARSEVRGRETGDWSYRHAMASNPTGCGLLNT